MNSLWPSLWYCPGIYVEGVRKAAGTADNLAGSERGTFRPGSRIDTLDRTFHTDQCIPYITVLWVE